MFVEPGVSRRISQRDVDHVQERTCISAAGLQERQLEVHRDGPVVLERDEALPRLHTWVKTRWIKDRALRELAVRI